MNKNILTIKQYFLKGTFVIPSYQRGFKWGVPDKGNNCAVSILIKNLIDAYLRDDSQYFIEAVTVVEEHGNVILVDGQQRTTTLYLLFIALGFFDELKSVRLEYKIRQDSCNYLKQLLELKGEIKISDDVQDIYFFNRAIETVRAHFISDKNLQSYFDKQIIEKNLIEKNLFGFKNFLLKKVQLLYNVIDADKAIVNFIALNGLRAVMKDEELIKSDLLIKASRILQQETITQEEKLGFEWKINEDRNRMAHNWDKWLYWWNNESVKRYYGIDKIHPLYYLLITFWNINKKENNKSDFDFDNFKTIFLSDPITAKLTFESLRKLQKTFEDFYHTPEIYNYLGIILKTSQNKEAALRYFLGKKNEIDIKEYAKWALVGATHLEIINNTKEKTENSEISIKARKAQDAINLITEKYVYWDEKDQELSDRKEWAFKFLLLLNLMEDDKLNRKFDFSIWSNRSLEHIFPKSLKTNLNFDQDGFIEGSVHCIGNLVLLYGKNNSAFGAKEFDQKKLVYFNTGDNNEFQSRNLLHTLSVFASAQWSEKEIIANKYSTIKKIKKIYGLN